MKRATLTRPARIWPGSNLVPAPWRNDGRPCPARGGAPIWRRPLPCARRLIAMAMSERSAGAAAAAPPREAVERPRGRSLLSLLPLLRFLRPYRRQLIGASIALVISSAAWLLVGQGVRYLIDAALRAGDPTLLDRAAGALLIVIIVMAVSTYSRYSLVSWIGERVVADL